MDLETGALLLQVKGETATTFNFTLSAYKATPGNDIRITASIK